MSSGLISLTVNNWDAYNPRNDRANHTWFKFQNSFFTDPKIFVLTSDQKLILIFLFCEASKSGSGTFLVSPQQVCSVIGSSLDDFNKCLELLNSLDVITPSSGRRKVGHKPSLLLTTDRQTDRHNRQTDKRVPLPMLAELWNERIIGLAKVNGCSSSRAKSCKARLEENHSEAYWVSVIEKINTSKFCNGKNDRGWKANFDFFIRPDTHNKLIEGAYDFANGQKFDQAAYDEAERIAIHGRAEQ